MNLLATGIPLSLYIHLPWCVEKCPYCDFNSHKVTAEFDDQAYVTALFRDLEQDLPKVWGRSVETVFIGGGTPSLFSGEAIDNLLSGVRARLMLIADLEITLESNPGSADANNYLAYRQAGVNRLSIGVQSFNDQQLKTLGRIHNSSQAVRAMELARKAGFERINLDLMYALPAQSVQDALQDLNTAIALEPEHISWYQLTVEANTVYHSYPPDKLPDDDLIWEIQQAGQKKLQQAGYLQYEVSAWSKPGEACRHNLNYWQFGDYLGIGAGAHGKITDFSAAQILRTRRRKQPHHWLTKETNFLADCTPIPQNELAVEFMINTMRLNSGVSINSFSERTGLPIAHISDALNTAKEMGLLERRLDILRPTEYGLNYLNDLVALFMTDTIVSKRTTVKTAETISIKEIL